MKQFILFVFALMVSADVFGQAEIDSLYYDKNWKGVENKAFASYIRVIARSEDDNFSKRFRDYYISGELQGEGEYVSIDKYDDSKSVLDGECISYYKSGKIECKRNLVAGKTEGEYILYKEDGSIYKHAYFKDGKMNGIYTEFLKDGNMCMQIEYNDGTPTHDYYVLSDKNNFCSKIKLSDNQPIYESPELNEIQKRYDNGKLWSYYNKNGLMVSISNELVKDYGKYFRVTIVVANNSMFPVEYNPGYTTAMFYDESGQSKILKVFSANEYMRRVKRRQNWARAFYGISEGLAAAGAGVSYSHTDTSYSGYSSTYGSSSSYGRGGYRSGNYSGNTYYSGTAHSSTTTYDGAAAYQAQVIASNRIAAFDERMLSERAAKNRGYLKRTTIEPGDMVIGYINIDRKNCKAGMLSTSINIKGAIYTFPWTFVK